MEQIIEKLNEALADLEHLRNHVMLTNGHPKQSYLISQIFEIERDIERIKRLIKEN